MGSTREKIGTVTAPPLRKMSVHVRHQQKLNIFAKSYVDSGNDASTYLVVGSNQKGRLDFPSPPSLSANFLLVRGPLLALEGHSGDEQG